MNIHKRNKASLDLLTQGVNGIAEMYAELSAKYTQLEGTVSGCATQCREAQAAVQRLERAVAQLQQDNQTALARQLMDDYCYGAEEGEHD